jgi:hypothetical protein
LNHRANPGRTSKRERIFERILFPQAEGGWDSLAGPISKSCFLRLVIRGHHRDGCEVIRNYFYYKSNRVYYD